MTTQAADRARLSALNQYDKAQRNFKLAILGGFVVEAVFLIGMLLLIDLHDRLQLVVFLSAVGSYFVILMGIVALGAWINRKLQGVLRGMEELRQ